MVRKIVGLVLIILITLTGLCWGQARNDRQNGEVLRLHVIANSDQSGDQAVKLKVRDSVVDYLSEEFTCADNADQARQMAIAASPQIEEIAARVVKSEGYSYPVEVKVGLYNFPSRTYGDLVLPQGEYQAVKVILGEGKGQNWWCVLFPPLCLVASSDQGLALQPSHNAEIKWKLMELFAAD